MAFQRSSVTIPQSKFSIGNTFRFLPFLLIVSLVAIHNASASDIQQFSKLAYYLQLYNSINTYRAKHVAPALRWNRTLNEVAETLAERILAFPDSTFDPDDFEGVNYYETGGVRPPPNVITATWYNESSSFNFNFPQYSVGSLNFSQMVWKSSTTLGVGSATLNNVTVVVAKFNPPGNVKGRFRLNVIPIRKLR